jgi:hypothetical protein
LNECILFRTRNSLRYLGELINQFTHNIETLIRMHSSLFLNQIWNFKRVLPTLISKIIWQNFNFHLISPFANYVLYFFFPVQNPGSLLGDVGHTFNKLSVKNQKAKLFCFRLRKFSFSFYLILNKRNDNIVLIKLRGFFLEGRNFRLGLNPQIGRPLSRIVVPLVYFSLFRNFRNFLEFWRIFRSF